jgi:DNA polymerase-3 subunit beta
MKFSVQNSDLQKALAKVSGVIPSKSTLPILENLLFSLTKDVLTITATDLEISMTATVQVQGSEDGKIAVPARRLIETVRALPDVPVSFHADLASNKIVMKTSMGEYKLTGEASDEFPSVPEFDGEDEVAIDSDELRRMIGKTLFAVSTDELRPSMMGILFQIKKNELRAVSTDGHRLVRYIRTSFSSPKLQRDIIIPSKALNLVARSAEEAENRISLNKSHVKVRLGTTTLISRLIDETYPNYETVIPKENTKELVVKKDALLSSVRRVALYSSSTTHQIRFTLAKSEMNVSAEDVDFGGEATEKLECQYRGDEMEIGFNAAYIVDILSHLDSDEVVFKLSSPTRAGIVQPAAQREHEDLLMLVMPVRLNV